MTISTTAGLNRVVRFAFSRFPFLRLLLLVIGAFAVAACTKKKETELVIATAPVERRSIVLSAQANGVVEPVTIIEVKSRASGQITNMPVDVGSVVKRGDLLVQIDARDVQSRYNQAAAELNSSTVARTVAASQRARSRDLFQQRIITEVEMEAATLQYANADASVVRARAALDIARQQLQDATITAPTAGTVIERPVSEGTVITSATSSASGGTTILKMADLSKVRMRAMVNETDIGNIIPGQMATVTVDAFPNRRFQGVVEKVEPQAVVLQNVTMFPVLVSLTNFDGALKPGMNGEVEMEVARRDNVLAIPAEAVRSMRDASTVAPALGLNEDAIRNAAQASFASRNPEQTGPGGASGDTSRRAGRGARRAAGDTAGVRRRSAQGGAPGQAGSATSGGAQAPAAGSPGGAATGAGGGGGGRGAMQIAFVKKADDYVARRIRTGISDFEYTEVLSGLELGEQVALVGVAVLQAQRDEQQARIAASRNTGLQQATTDAPAAGGGGGGGGRR
ncbi:MAG TPA: efflux RND transporter periplasmic adaptor subunit [Gemmatimonadaceae bacterium]|nr:efflux RND transporter periplasmic adaptor subunit [Gemmatimonadaceae bacterium]